MLRVITIKSGTKYGPEYANKLYRMVMRYLNVPHTFLCLTDDSSGMECACHSLWRKDLDLTGWWNKMLLFDPQAPAWRDGDQLLWLDLDVVIVGPLDQIAEFPTRFAMHRDFQKPHRMASAVMLLAAGSRPEIWERFIADPATAMRDRHGDQAFIDAHVQDMDVLPSRWIVSYKMHAKAQPPDGARIVCFHGKPKMSDIKSGWVPAAWG